MNSKAIKDIKPIEFQWETSDPFLFCAYHNDSYPVGDDNFGPKASLQGRNIGMDFDAIDGWRMYHGNIVPGFPVHPHRGFETVTVVQKGLVDHSDSLGAAGRYGGGDVQWLTTGKGVQHSEMFPLVNRDKANPLVLFQVWLNLPAASKMVEPHFSMFWANNIPQKVLKDEAGNSTTVDVIAGQLEDKQALAPPPDSWAANTDNHVAIWTIVMSAGARWELPKSEKDLNRTLYIYQGDSLNVDGENISAMHSVELQSDMDVVLQNADKECRLLLLQGRPINEPVVQHGPFVMNTNDEIRQTISDYQQTQFGGWPWPSRDPVHAGKDRFAKHADGKIEEAE
jgi:redox-sensitive bicupin YhaK (pirin superfamily)